MKDQMNDQMLPKEGGEKKSFLMGLGLILNEPSASVFTGDSPQVVPCILLALFIHPYSLSFRVNYIIWAFTVYLEAISVLPQLHVMQNAKV